MANDLNQCNFIGRLGQGPEVKYLPTGTAVVNISLAVGSQWKDKNTGQKQESTEWVRVTAFGKLGEIIGEYCKKGQRIFITGRMRTRKWTDQQGVDKYSTEIVAENMQMLDSAQGSGNQEGQPQKRQQREPQPQQNRQPAQQSRHAPPPDGFDGFEDDFPF